MKLESNVTLVRYFLWLITFLQIYHRLSAWNNSDSMWQSYSQLTENRDLFFVELCQISAVALAEIRPFANTALAEILAGFLIFFATFVECHWIVLDFSRKKTFLCCHHVYFGSPITSVSGPLGWHAHSCVQLQHAGESASVWSTLRLRPLNCRPPNTIFYTHQQRCVFACLFIWVVVVNILIII